MFKYRDKSDFCIYYTDYHHLLELIEVYIDDIYHSDLLRKNDTVIDMGAGIGDFAILASKRVGGNGRVIAIEPNLHDFQLLKLNIERNNCANVIPVNLGIGSKPGESETTFWGRTFRFKIDTLENVLQNIGVDGKANFVKMDIEGFEFDVVKASLGTIRLADFISLEFHDTREEMDKLLIPEGFYLEEIGGKYKYKKMTSALLRRPQVLLSILSTLITEFHDEWLFAFFGSINEEGHFSNGIYRRKGGQF